MGGINSGRQRSVYRGAVEQYPCIDLRILKRAGLLRDGECTYHTLNWRNQATSTPSARILIDLCDKNYASVRIFTKHRQIAGNQCVEMTSAPCRFGGMRHYLVCPINGHRCELLFFIDGIWASRQAHALTYLTHTCDELSRARRKVAKLHRQVDGDTRYSKPRGHNRERKEKSLREAKSKVRNLYNERLRGLIES
jgi:hypothetical protein